MSVDQTNVIDFITTHVNGSIVLVISDHLAWNDVDEHLLLLQKKINSYLQFIESEQIINKYPTAKGKQIEIEVKAKYQPDEQGLRFLNLCKKKLESAGIIFKWKSYNNR